MKSKLNSLLFFIVCVIPANSVLAQAYVVKDIKKGEVITTENVRSIRPGYGLHPKYLKNILGKKVKQDLNFGTRMNLDFVNADNQD